MKTETNIHELAIRYFEGHISKAEEKLLFSYIEQAEENRLRFRQWEKEWKVTNEGNVCNAAFVRKRLLCRCCPVVISASGAEWLP